MSKHIVATGHVTQKSALLLRQENFSDTIFELKPGESYELTIIKPENKKLDWSKIPIDTLLKMSTGGNEFIRHFAGLNESKKLKIKCFNNGGSSKFSDGTSLWEKAELAEQPTFTYWPGGECPLPDGVLVEVIFRCGDCEKHPATPLDWSHDKVAGDIIAYRIIGLADGWEY